MAADTASICYDFFLNRTCFQGELFPWTELNQNEVEHDESVSTNEFDHFEKKKKNNNKKKNKHFSYLFGR